MLRYEQLYIEDKKINLDNFKNIYVIGAGKASGAMAGAIENILMKRITSGLVCVKYEYGVRLHKILTAEAGHPVPDENSYLAARKTYDLVQKCGVNDLIICLISGGASSIWALPHPPIPFQDKQKTTEILLGCGADIHELNVIRRHISRIKGGQLAKAAYPAKLVTLAISDVVGNKISSIGSGPTVPDPSTFTEALEIILKYKLSESLPASVTNHLWAGTKGEIKETPKPGDSLFKGYIECIVANNSTALESAKQTAKYLGFKVEIFSTELTGEAREVGIKLAEKAKRVKQNKPPGSPPVLLLSGGETTVILKGDGKGGRNQELVLAAAIELDKQDGIMAVSFGTDGTDGEKGDKGDTGDTGTNGTNGTNGTLGLPAAPAAPAFTPPVIINGGPTGGNVSLLPAKTSWIIAWLNTSGTALNLVPGDPNNSN